jgi:hypothetical protein
VSSAKHNLPCADAHKIPLWRDWALARLTFMSAGRLLPVIETGFWKGYVSAFCIILIIFLKHAAKVGGEFQTVYTAGDANRNNTGANRINML